MWKNALEIDYIALAADNERWWHHSLGRPIIDAVVGNPEAVSGNGVAPKRFLANYDFDIPAEIVVADAYRKLAQDGYAGDGFPLQWMNFGPGVLAAMVGGEGKSSPETVWFEPGRFTGRELSDIHIQFEPESVWARRLAEMYRAAVRVMPEHPCVLGMTDLGGVFDVLASLRGTNELLLDLFDAPEEVNRLLDEEATAWQTAYEWFDRLIRSASPAHAVSCWAGILSVRRCYMLQSDFSYMISPEMFDEFTAPRLERQCAFLDHAFYHLDGKNQLAHLPRLLSMPGLDGIQWIPGDGQAPQCDWPEVLSAIEDAGVNLQLLGNTAQVEKALRRMKHPELAHVLLYVEPGEREHAERLMADFS